MVILEPDGTVARHDGNIDVVTTSDDVSSQHYPRHRTDAPVDEQQPFDVFGLSEVAREIEQAAVRISSELHQLASLNELSLFNQHLPQFPIPAMKLR